MHSLSFVDKAHTLVKQIIQGVINKRSIAKLRIEIAAYDDAIYYNNNAGAEARAFKRSTEP